MKAYAHYPRIFGYVERFSQMLQHPHIVKPTRLTNMDGRLLSARQPDPEQVLQEFQNLSRKNLSRNGFPTIAFCPPINGDIYITGASSTPFPTRHL